ncbi:MAG TPA: hypothetical protein VMH82_08170 [Myxococcota bacterium]|nr:hypothetical protein [Myxococcota bacterium]
MKHEGWVREGRSWLHPVCEFFVVEREAPELAGGGIEYHVVRSGGDSTAGLSVAVFSSADDAIADAERRDAERRARG